MNYMAGYLQDIQTYIDYFESMVINFGVINQVPEDSTQDLDDKEAESGGFSAPEEERRTPTFLSIENISTKWQPLYIWEYLIFFL